MKTTDDASLRVKELCRSLGADLVGIASIERFVNTPKGHPNQKYQHDISIFTFPILISLLMEMMIGVTDTAFLGRVGEVELGAYLLSRGCSI